VKIIQSEHIYDPTADVRS